MTSGVGTTSTVISGTVETGFSLFFPQKIVLLCRHNGDSMGWIILDPAIVNVIILLASKG